MDIVIPISVLVELQLVIINISTRFLQKLLFSTGIQERIGSVSGNQLWWLKFSVNSEIE